MNPKIKKVKKLLLRKPRQRPLPQKRRIKIAFVCTAGQESSLAGKHTFQKLLRERGLLHLFELHHVGQMGRKPGAFEADLRKVDFVVPMVSAITPTIAGNLRKANVGKKVVDLNFETISDQYDQARYEVLLQHVLKKRRL